ncbi:serum amyloid A-5 protein-like [Saccostrea echinata]|uniref:serum amyloid A-5 protein-like n=1 Tax=Saccostrea echinata TaxID=191078 RepID=UPI002A83F02C|nr:serum amyloid A-5 protein-like [Saccostrea echinata]XP_061180086.1 serum amyloid A-5 protein-like [Saccostrea echinata]
MRTITLVVVSMALILTKHAVVKGWWISQEKEDHQYPTETDNKVKEKVEEAIDFVKDAFGGAIDMGRAYLDMREANVKNADKYFHARGNYDAAKRGPGGALAAKVLSDFRELYQSSLSGEGPEDTAKDQEANEWGRNGGDPNKYRPKGLPDKYR